MIKMSFLRHYLVDLVDALRYRLVDWRLCRETVIVKTRYTEKRYPSNGGGATAIHHSKAKHTKMTYRREVDERRPPNRVDR